MTFFFTKLCVLNNFTPKKNLSDIRTKIFTVSLNLLRFFGAFQYTSCMSAKNIGQGDFCAYFVS